MYSSIKKVLELRQYSTNIIFTDFIKVFEEIVDKTHDKMDITDNQDELLRYQGSNRTLKKLIKDLTQEIIKEH